MFLGAESLQDTTTWKGSLRTTLNTKNRAFEKTTKVDVESGKKVKSTLDRHAKTVCDVAPRNCFWKKTQEMRCFEVFVPC